MIERGPCHPQGFARPFGLIVLEEDGTRSPDAGATARVFPARAKIAPLDTGLLMVRFLIVTKPELTVATITKHASKSIRACARSVLSRQIGPTEPGAETLALPVRCSCDSTSIKTGKYLSQSRMQALMLLPSPSCSPQRPQPLHRGPRSRGWFLHPDPAWWCRRRS